MPEADPVSSKPAVTPEQLAGYIFPDDLGGCESADVGIDGAIPEGELRAGIVQHGAPAGVLVLAVTGPSGTEFVPYFSAAWLPGGWTGIVRYRGRGFRSFRDLSRLAAWIWTDLGYAGEIILVRHTDNVVAQYSLPRISPT
ncbi:hypothetical protein [Roseomonas chloroacetimidivorans]|uniref:hypothetical protein n=1 Tax=Roseomonas chloroacetimidivorans TaxID=1766656 RepID=UPI003C716A4F